MGTYGKTLSLASKERAKEISLEAKQFVDQTNKFSDARFVAAMAVAEYIANQKGETLYESRVGTGWVLVSDGLPDTSCFVGSEVPRG